MKLRTKLLCYTAAVTLSAGAAFAAIDGNQLANDYLSQGYTFVEVKIGPTQTKVEAIKDASKVEVVYDNETGAIVKQETEAVSGDDATQTGSEVTNVGQDFDRATIITSTATGMTTMMTTMMTMTTTMMMTMTTAAAVATAAAAAAAMAAAAARTTDFA